MTGATDPARTAGAVAPGATGGVYVDHDGQPWDCREDADLANARLRRRRRGDASARLRLPEGSDPSAGEVAEQRGWTREQALYYALLRALRTEHYAAIARVEEARP